MNKSDSISKLAAALAKAQASFGMAQKDAANPAFARGAGGGKYATLASVIEAQREALGANELALVQLTKEAPVGFVTVESVLLHSSGEWISADLTLPAGGTPQSYGSALTYCRRYGQSALLNIAPDEDDDGNAATSAVVQRAVPTPSRPNPPQGEAAPRQAPPSPPKSTPAVESFESLKRDLGQTDAGPAGHLARLELSKRVLSGQKAGQLSPDQVVELRALYDSREKATS